jgi:hypothetical protein
MLARSALKEVVRAKHMLKSTSWSLGMVIVVTSSHSWFYGLE